MWLWLTRRGRSSRARMFPKVVVRWCASKWQNKGMKTLVVGAGIAGLVCADELARRGQDVEVYEASGRAGGRIETVTVGGCRVEVGANFLSSTYRVIPALASRLGVALRPIRCRAGVISDSGAVTYGPGGLSLVRSGVIGWRDAVRAGWGFARQAGRFSRCNPADVTRWADVDVPADQWCVEHFGPGFTDAVIASALRGYYFQDLADTSASAVLAMLAYASRSFVALTADGGLEEIPRALASGLRVHYDSEVVRVERDGRGAVLVLASGESVEADRVVLTVPGASAARILSDPGPVERELMATPYSSGVLAVVSMRRKLGESELGGAYGLLASPASGGPVAALCVASRAGHATVGRDAVTVMFDGDEAWAGLGGSDAEVVEGAVAELCELEPSLEGAVDMEASRVVRIGQAMPTCRVGRACLVRGYRRGQRGPVVLAGDYLGFAWSDSAALTGLWAARRVLES